MSSAEVKGALTGFERRIRELETFAGDQFQRLSIGGGGGVLNIVTVNVLPAIPTKKTIIFLESVDAAQLPALVPKPDAKDAYWWAATEDVRWHPFGGKFVDINGDPGDYSAV